MRSLRLRHWLAMMVCLALFPVTAISHTKGPTLLPSPVYIAWYPGFATNDEQIAAEKNIAEEFNNSQKKIEVNVQMSANFPPSINTYEALIANGEPPDILGPVGISGGNPFAERWMDLKPLIDQNHYDLSVYDPAVLNIYQTANGGYDALPFAVYPSVVYYNTTLFDQAGLKVPPHKFGDPYVMPDGTKLDWNYDTLAMIAKRLTLDKNGNDATSSNFDSGHIVQYGLNFQWALMRLVLTDLQPVQLYDPVSKKVTIPDAWHKATQWVWNGLWKDHFISNATAEASSLFQTSAFDSGHVAMSIVPIWYTCCLQDTAGKLNWNIAVVPKSFDGKYHVAVDADTFHIDIGTKHPQEAFQVLSYLTNQAVPELSATYGAFPARPQYQQAWFTSWNKIYPQQIDWQVALDSLHYVNPAPLHHESNLPHFQAVQDRFAAFYASLFGDSGATMDVDKSLNQLQTDVQASADGTFPTSTPIPTTAPAWTATPDMTATPIP